MECKKFKDLEYLCEIRGEAKTCFVLFHGYGADAEDMINLAQSFQLSERVDWFFPQGIDEIPIGAGLTGRVWFHLRSSDFESIETGDLPDEGVLSQAHESVERIREWLNHLGGLYQNVFIGGFSQGAILVSHCFYGLNFVPKALLLFSGVLVVPSLFPILPESLKIPFFQSHGSDDSVLSISGAHKLHEKLLEIGLKGQWFEFAGGHGIPQEVINKVNIFLADVLDPSE